MSEVKELRKDTSLFKGIPVAEPTYKQLQVIVGSPEDFPELTKLTNSDGKKLDTSQKYLGDNFNLEMDFLSIEDPNLFKDVVNEVNEANDKVNELRLKSVGTKGLTEVEKRLLEIKNSYISEIYTKRDQGALDQQAQMEAEARMLTAEAELYLSADGDTDLEFVYNKLKALAAKMGGRVPFAIQAKLQQLESKIASKSRK